MGQRCQKCVKDKPVSDFALDNQSTNGLQSWCKACSNTARRERYRNNKTSENAIINQSKHLRKVENYKKMWEYFESHPCVDCGEDDPLVLQNDHVRGVKQHNISQMLSKCQAWKTILTELAKCETRCANCHLRKTAKELGWRKFMETTPSISSSQAEDVSLSN